MRTPPRPYTTAPPPHTGVSCNQRIIDDRIEKYDAYVVVTALAHPPTTPIPHAWPGVGYICGLWVLPGRYNSQSKRANADCAQFIFPLYSFSILSSIILWLRPNLISVILREPVFATLHSRKKFKISSHSYSTVVYSTLE